VVAGDGPDGDALRVAAEQVPSPIHFVGHQTEVGPWYGIADVVWMPSHYEAFGLSAAEAMACERPVVASGVGGLTEVVADGVTGVLIPPQDADALRRATLPMLDDTAVRRSLGKAGRARYLEHFTLERMADGVLECYRELLER
jgi:glycosyltransferase involved in cell wall biosynthesis